jgi:hypothetical protein
MKVLKTGLEFKETNLYLGLGISHLCECKFDAHTLYYFINKLKLPTRVVIKLFNDSNELYYTSITRQSALDLVSHGDNLLNLNFHLSLVNSEKETLFVGELIT